MKKIGEAFAIIALCVLVSCGDYVVKNGNISVNIDSKGNISELEYRGTVWDDVNVARVDIDGYNLNGVSSRVDGDTVYVVKNLVNDSTGRKAVLTEYFFPVGNSLRWECVLTGDDTPCSSAIKTVFRPCIDSLTRAWTAWGRPQIDISKLNDEKLRNELKLMNIPSNNWLNPLVAIPFTDALYYYGAPYVTNENPEIAYCPIDFGFMHKKYNGAIISIPMITVLDKTRGNGISVVLDIDEYTQDLTLETKSDGEIVFARYNHRIVDSNPIKFSCDIIGAEDDWREALAWVSSRYNDYFEPENRFAKKMGGTGAYTTHDADFDIQKMKDMAFSVNWRASFDFPYMGMFIPPVKDIDEQWTSFNKEKTSIRRMARYSTDMKNAGFYVLNYFNITEFGSYVDPERKITENSDTAEWKICEEYLYGKLGDAILTVPDGMNLEGCIYPKTKNGGPFYTWEDGVIMDCGVKSYADFLMSQAEKHLKYMPDSYGFCIDRMDWTRMFNIKRDDGRSWYDGMPVSSMVLSWKEFMEDYSRLVHGADKVIFVNNHTKRIDLLKHADGFFEEFTNGENPLNSTAFTALYKPFLGWTPSIDDVRRDGADNFFQKYLYMGASPMCPFPGNDHSIRPDEWVDQQYIDYGALIKSLNEREWVLSREPVRVVSEDAKANIFKVADSFVVPVVYAKTDKATIEVGAITEGGWHVEVIHPGEKEFKPLADVSEANPVVEIPIVRGCAIVRFTK